MTQNRSSAVMQQRAEPHDSLDDFPTPPWATRALCNFVLPPSFIRTTVAEPAANRGFMARPLKEYFSKVYASDICDYGQGYEVGDFLLPGQLSWDRSGVRPHWIITNPPFRLAQEFIWKARNKAQWGCAVLVRTAFLEGVQRYSELFRDAPPSIIAQFSERVPMVKGRVDIKASTATSYCWLVWLSDALPKAASPFIWIPPCRKRLERPGDYGLPRGAP